MPRAGACASGSCHPQTVNGFLELLVALVIVVGLVGTVIQVIPGLFLVGGAVLVWGIVTGGTVGWSLAALALGLMVLGTIAKYGLAGRYLVREGVSSRSLVLGAVGAVIGFFVIPVVGLIVGFVAGTWLAEWQRLADHRAAWSATVVAMKATGLSILIELAAALLLATAWVVALIVT